MKASETSEITIISSYSPINKRQTSLEFRQDLWKSNFTKFRSQISFRYVCVFKEVCKPLFHFYFAKSCFVNIITGCGLISRASLKEDHFSISQEARIAFGYTSSNSYASFVPSKLPACFISRWTHSWRMNQLFYNIFNPMEIFFLKGFVMSVDNRNMKHARAIEFD